MMNPQGTTMSVCDTSVRKFASIPGIKFLMHFKDMLIQLFYG